VNLAFKIIHDLSCHPIFYLVQSSVGQHSVTDSHCELYKSQSVQVSSCDLWLAEWYLCCYKLCKLHYNWLWAIGVVKHEYSCWHFFSVIVR